MNGDGIRTEAVLIVFVIPFFRDRDPGLVGLVGVGDAGSVNIRGVSFHRIFADDIGDFAAVIVEHRKIAEIIGPVITGCCRDGLDFRSVSQQTDGDGFRAEAVLIVSVVPCLGSADSDFAPLIRDGDRIPAVVGSVLSQRIGNREINRRIVQFVTGRCGCFHQRVAAVFPENPSERVLVADDPGGSRAVGGEPDRFSVLIGHRVPVAGLVIAVQLIDSARQIFLMIFRAHLVEDDERVASGSFAGGVNRYGVFGALCDALQRRAVGEGLAVLPEHIGAVGDLHPGPVGDRNLQDGVRAGK